MTLHDSRPLQWPPATATVEYLAAYEPTDATTSSWEVWQQVRVGGRCVLEEPAAGIVLVGLSREAAQRLSNAAADFDPVSTLVTDRGWRFGEDSDAMWELVRCWPGLSGGAIPVVTGE